MKIIVVWISRSSVQVWLAAPKTGRNICLFLFLLKKVFVLAVQKLKKKATFVLKYKNIKYSKKPGTFSGFFTIPEEN